MKRLLVVCLFVAAALPLAAQKPAPKIPQAVAPKPQPKVEMLGEQSLTGDKALVEAPEAAAIKNLTWRAIGPANPGGRVPAIAGVPGDPSTFYVGGANGGIFKTTNGGTTFKPIFDNQPVISIGAIALAPSNPNIVYVGSGEGNPRNDASIGNGLYRSNDGGDTWTHLGLDDTDQITRVVIDPRNPDIVYVAALGHEWGPTENRGLYKTTDGGKTWKKILYKDQQTGCSDVDIDPTNSDVVYAGMWTYLRRPWHFDSGGGETAVYKSVDGGATWKKLTSGLPEGPMDRIGIAVSRSNPDVVYVVSETKDEGELWRSDDSGATWRVANRDPNINFRPFYYSDIRVDPQDPNRIFSLSGSLNLSEDGGRTFQRIAEEVHGDHQSMWIDPTNPKRILEGSDGGFQVSNDGGKTWEVVNNIAFTQFYHVAYDMRQPYYVCGGLQDNGNWCGPSRTTYAQGNRKSDWYTVSYGDGFFAVPDLKDPYLVYSDSQGGNIVLTDLRSGTERAIHPYPNRVGSAGDAMADHKYRFNWNSPIALSPQDPKTVYFGGNVLFKTTNGGQSWEAISPDLTTNDKSKQQSSGGPIVVDNTAAEFHCTILTIAPSPVDPNVIWVGTDDGNVQVTKDGGKTWTNVVKNVPGMAPFAWISTIEASHVDAGMAYVAADHHQDNDYAPYAYKTTDYGQTWKAIRGNLPSRGWVHVVREDPKNRNLLYAGTEFGLFASWDGGTRWVSIRNNMPVNPVRDIAIHPRDNDIIVATHGRGAFVLDDATPLQELAEALQAEVKLFEPRPGIRYSIWNRDTNLGQKEYVAQNPPYGAIISYYLKSEPKGDVAIAVLDTGGRPIRQIRTVPKQAGVNRVAWDLRYDGPRMPGGGTERAPAAAARFGGGGGPFVVPGTYTVKLTVGGKDYTTPAQVQMDPRITVSAADLQAQLDAALTLRDMTSKVNAMVERVDDLLRQLTPLSERLQRGSGRPASATSDGHDGGEAQTASPSPALTEVNAAIDQLKALRNDRLTRPLQGLQYRQYPRLLQEISSLLGVVSRTAYKPTDPEMLRLQELKVETDKMVVQFNEILTKTIAHINEVMAKSPFIVAGGPIK